jgi:DNA-binding SARP family transcriptional activator/Tfp pilus assembly protein PilF
MQVRLLGPVDVVVDGVPRPVRGLRRKALLAALALQAGQAVSTSQLIEIVWGQSAPPTAAATLQNHVSHLRRVLGGKAAIRAQPPGYLLDSGKVGTDVQAAERLLHEGSLSADPREGTRRLRAALALWRGRPLADVAGLPWLEQQAARLDLLGAQVSRALAEARLAAGEHDALVPELEQMAASAPLDEQVHAQLMLALYRSGRQADALDAYQRVRRTLDEELGILPGRALRDLEAAILRQDPAIDPPAGPHTPVARQEPPVPAQLPPAVPAFTGRGAELAALDRLLAAPGAGEVMAIAAVSGTAGVGKTTMVVHWAHRASAHFPGGQLYVNLQGFGPDGAALEPGEVVHGFLEALGVPATKIPAGLPARTALYRSALAGRRVLVVLDNARDAQQVRPLLPGSPGCLTVVTSRSELTGLIAAEGALGLGLDVLPARDARDLLAGRVGEARAAAESAAVDDIVAGCARLPLALTVAAARAAARPGFSLAAVAAELRRASSALDPFHVGDASTDVRAVFSWSYRALGAPAARIFRLLGLHPGPEIAAAAAASLAAVCPDRARMLLGELARAHLLTEHAPGRYTCHDLLRAYAAELVQAHEPGDARHAATRRLLDHYLHTGHGAALLLDPSDDPFTLAPAEPRAVVEELSTAADAMAWLAAERAGILAAVRLAGASGFETHAWQLAWAVSAFLLRTAAWDDIDRAQRAALEAALRAGDIAGQGHALHGLARGYARSGRFAEAYPCFQDALRHFVATGDHVSQAHVHSSLAWLAEREQHPADALSHALAALDLHRAAGQPGPAEVLALNDVGYCHALVGNYAEAVAFCERALAASQELGERNWEAATWDSLGYIQHRLGDHQRAVRSYERAIGIYRELADRFNEADSLDHLGDVRRDAGDAQAARAAWAQALRILAEVGHPDADGVRAKLAPGEAAREADRSGRAVD